MSCSTKRGPRHSRWPMIKAFAPAKINLSLHVVGQRADGYHLLESLVVFADVGDTLWLTAGDSLALTVEGPFAEGVPEDRRNLVWQAAELAGWTGHIRLEKHLPHGGGIGGGSSDAAAVLRAVGGADQALALGADVPVCIAARTAIMSGIGEVVAPLARPLPPLHAVLVNPGVHVATPDVFKSLTCKENPPIEDGTEGDDALDWLACQRNDLQIPAMTLAPVIGQVIALLGALPEVRLVRMSGSGSTCFGLFDTPEVAQRAACDVLEQHPDWWVKSCMLGRA